MATSNPISLTKAEVIDLMRGIALGRTLHDLEKQSGVSVESFLFMLQTDQDVAFAFKKARELSSYVLEDEVTDKLRLNADEPTSAAKTNALKAWADHVDSIIKARNPMVYSGKVDVGAAINVRFVTTLDLNAPKTIDNVYDLTGTVVEEAEIKDVTETDFNRLVDGLTNEATSSPFSTALALSQESESIEQAAARLEQAIDGSEPADGYSSLGESQSAQAERVEPAPTKAVPPKKRRASRSGTGKEQAKTAKVQ